MTTEITTILSPAKININLKVLSKRSDGYHNIKSRFQLIDLCDEITFKLTQDKDVIVNLGLSLKIMIRILCMTLPLSLGLLII